MRSLGEGVTLGNILQMLDEHYGVMMTFDTLSMEIYSLKQGMGENVAELGVCLSQQVQILKIEYPSRFQQKHVEKLKWHHFYEGLSPKSEQMLAHKVSGENPVTYSKLFLAAQKLERWAEARDPQLLKPLLQGV